jgi:hypothetical protein
MKLPKSNLLRGKTRSSDDFKYGSTASSTFLSFVPGGFKVRDCSTGFVVGWEWRKNQEKQVFGSLCGVLQEMYFKQTSKQAISVPHNRVQPCTA